MVTSSLAVSTAYCASDRSLLSCSTVMRACATHWSCAACAETSAASFCASCCLAWLESNRITGSPCLMASPAGAIHEIRSPGAMGV